MEVKGSVVTNGSLFAGQNSPAERVRLRLLEREVVPQGQSLSGSARWWGPQCEGGGGL